MSRMTLDDLRKLRETKRSELGQRDPQGKAAEVLVGMGTCGIAAGAKSTFDAMLEEIGKAGMADSTIVKQTGCMGFCHSEPTVEVRMKDMPTVVYGDVDADVGRKIVRRHLGKAELVNDHIYEKPSADILQAGETRE